MPMLKRINLCVADMERSLKVYRDILGFTVNYMKDSASDSYSYPVFMFPKEAKLRFATLDSPTQERTFALTEVRGIDLPKLPVPKLPSRKHKLSSSPPVLLPNQLQTQPSHHQPRENSIRLAITSNRPTTR